MSDVRFELPIVLALGLPLLAVLLWAAARRMRREGGGARARATLLALRGAALLGLVVLLARPVAPQAAWDPAARRTVVLLVDRSRSMGLEEDGRSRYADALEWTAQLTSALEAAGLKVRLLAFDQTTGPLTQPPSGAAAATGPQTDLGAGILQSVAEAEPPPAAVVALTDGVATRAQHNAAALLALVDTRTPFVGIGIGRDAAAPSLSVRRLHAPQRVPPKQAFRVSAQLEGTDGGAAADLLLLRDGTVVQSRQVAKDESRRGRVWAETFDVTEPAAGLVEYTVQLRLPPDSGVVSSSTRSSTAVRVGAEEEFRILYVQGSLTWDFKFVNRALRGDPTIRVTGLSRTSKQSVFRQNVEKPGELASGFPADMKEIAPYRALVLSELRAGDLTPAQQELVARFCGELGGGVLMIGGQSTFDESWEGSRLEQLLPVTFDRGGVSGLDKPFRLRLTDEARQNAIFTVADGGSSARAWDTIPPLTGYGRALREKPGATVWARHESESGPHGRRILVASQLYGSGVAAVIAVQDLWRWRLAPESDPATYDRFWQQWLRFLGQSGGQPFEVQVLEQQDAGGQVRALVHARPRPGADGGSTPSAKLRVTGPGGDIVHEQELRTVAGRPLEFRFPVIRPGVYTVTLTDARGVALARHPVDVPEVDREMERTGRDMDNLRQWATASGGAALTSQEAKDASTVAARIRKSVETAQSARQRARPMGIGAPTLVFLLLTLGTEWILRKRWGLR